MFELFALFFYAIVLGLFHAFEGDHIAAVSAIATESKKTTRLGFLWGLGHTATLLLVGTFVLLLGVVVPESFSSTFETIVGVLLVLLGVGVIYKARKDKLDIHRHSHDGIEHVHLHTQPEPTKHKHGRKSFIFGLFHGLAGSGALLLLILPTTSTALEGILFILVFGAGSVFGMTFVSFLLGKVLERADNFLHIVRYSAGALSIFIGLTVVFSTLSL